MKLHRFFVVQSICWESQNGYVPTKNNHFEVAKNCSAAKTQMQKKAKIQNKIRSVKFPAI